MQSVVYEIVIRTTDRDKADLAQDILMQAGIKFRAEIKRNQEDTIENQETLGWN